MKRTGEQMVVLSATPSAALLQQVGRGVLELPNMTEVEDLTFSTCPEDIQNIGERMTWAQEKGVALVEVTALPNDPSLKPLSRLYGSGVLIGSLLRTSLRRVGTSDPAIRYKKVGLVTTHPEDSEIGNLTVGGIWGDTLEACLHDGSASLLQIRGWQFAETNTYDKDLWTGMGFRPSAAPEIRKVLHLVAADLGVHY